MPSVTAKQNEHADSLLRRFKRACEKAAILTEVKQRARHIKKTKRRAQQKAAAIKRHLKRLAKEAPIPSRGVRGHPKSTKFKRHKR